MEAEEIARIEAELDEVDLVLEALDTGIDEVRATCERHPHSALLVSCADVLEPHER